MTLVEISIRLGKRFTSNCRAGAFLVLVLMLASLSAAAASPRAQFQVYFLAVGSSDYVTALSAATHSLSEIPGANQSARLVGDRLTAGGAVYGIVLTSSIATFVSLGDIQAALQRVEARITTDHPSSPLLVFYFAGHGMAEGVGWSHFSIPGDFVYAGDPSQLRTDQLANHTLYAGNLSDQLDSLHIPYLVMLDNCSEGKPAAFDSPVLTPQASDSLSGVASVLRQMNEFHQENPVIFSAAPGTVAEVTQDPTDPTGDLIAPMARRLVLILDKAYKLNHASSLSEIVSGLLSPSLDAQTRPSVSYAVPAEFWGGVLLKPTSKAAQIDDITGTAETANVCCQDADIAGSSAPKTYSFSGTMKIQGGKGEFITGGQLFNFTSPGTSFTLTESGDITIQTGQDEDGWTISFETPQGETLSTGTFDNVERDGFQDNDRPGLAITSPTRGCNQVTGSFQIKSIQFDLTGKITELSANFHQLCDDNPVWLDATVNLRASE